jgi:hypothetical protein
MRQMEEEERIKLEKQRDLLKQSHFPVDDIDIKALRKIVYGDNEADEAGEDKAEPSQFDALAPTEGVGERGELVAKAPGRPDVLKQATE